MEQKKGLIKMLIERERVRCRHCIYYKNATKDPLKIMPCKMIDHDTLRFAKQTFTLYITTFGNQLPCKYFEPNGGNIHLYFEWKGFDDWYRDYVEERSLLYINYSKCWLTGFNIKSHGDCIYYIPYLDFAYGSMFDADGKFKAIEKWYLKRNRGGYKGIREKIDGVYFDEVTKNRALTENKK